MASLSPFEFVNSINDTKVDLMVDEQAEKAYNSFMVNRALSYFPDTVLLANEANRMSHLGNRPKYLFLISTVRKRKRFSKWFKAKESDALLIVKEYYGYSNEKARSALAVLKDNHIDELRTRLYRGGRSAKPEAGT